MTGSRHLLEVDGKKILVDCGLFQGASDLRKRNWQPFPVPPSEIDAVVITHGHNDHIGYLPKFVKEGYRGPIYATRATIGLAKISLPDSARLQVEEAKYANRHREEGEPVREPLFDEEDVHQTLRLFESVPYRQLHKLPGGCQFQYFPAGHILGSAFAEVYFPSGERILMSGDLGRYDTPIIIDPAEIEFAEYLVLESTYGDRLHGNESPETVLELVLRRAIDEGGTVIVPSFAIGRTQELLYAIGRLFDRGVLPRIPIYLDSPMAISATELYLRCTEEHDEEMKIRLAEGDPVLDPPGVRIVRDASESKALNYRREPAMIISGSGMANGGRVVHHLKHHLNDPTTTVLFTGFQAAGTLGRRLIEGEPRVRIHGEEIDVRARVESINSLSAHADYGEILRWLGGFKTPPKTTFLVHGEPDAQDSLREKIERELGWKVEIPEQGRRFEL